MAPKMGFKVLQTILWLLLVPLVQSIEVNVTSEWQTELGWQVLCAWETLGNDSLQSVRLYNNEQQFMIYRPEMHGSSKREMFRTLEKMMNVDCVITAEKGQQGHCELTIEPLQPPQSDFTFTCEVSGERPWFRIEKKDYVVRVFVPPKAAVIVSNTQKDSSPDLITLNCTSAGLPAPSLQWTVGDDKVQADFKKQTWNVTSKLWDVWSKLSITGSQQTSVTCTPEVGSKGELLQGESARFNSSTLIHSSVYLIATLIAFYLFR